MISLAQIHQVAEEGYEAMRQLMLRRGETVPSWDRQTDPEIINDALHSASYIANGNIRSAVGIHAARCERHRFNGWPYGLAEDEARALHPTMKPVKHLTAYEREQDQIFFTTAKARIAAMEKAR